MTMESYKLIAYVSYGLTILLLIIATILFLAYRIPEVIGDISGRTARKAIDNIRRQNEETGEKSFKPSAVNVNRGKLTDEISESGNIIKHVTYPLGMNVETKDLGEMENNIQCMADETTILNDHTVSSLTIEAEITFIHTNEFIQ